MLDQRGRLLVAALNRGLVLAILGCLLLFATAHGVGAVAAAEPVKDEFACGQEPGNRFYWVERAFCDLQMNGPDKAHGVIIWNHGIQGTTEQWRYPVPPTFRLLQSRGWDVIAIKRHHQGDAVANPLWRAVQRTLEEAKTQSKLGYHRIVAAGQSFGGYISLEAVDTSPDFFAVVAMAPGVRAHGASGRLDAAVTDRILQRAKPHRFVLVFPKDDAQFGNLVRGESANRILAQRMLPYLLLDETSDLTGHGGGAGGWFAFRYGLCLADFLSAPEPATGRFMCQPSGDPWPLVRELLLPASADRPAIATDPAGLPAGLGRFTGLWFALVEKSVILFAVVPEGQKLRALYRSSSFSRTESVFDAEVRDGRIHVTLPQKDRITVAPDADAGLIMWTSSDGSRVLKGKLLRAPE